MTDDAVTQATPRWTTAIGMLGALLLVVVIGWVAVRSVTSDRGIQVPPDAAVPAFTSMSDAVAYYEEQRAALSIFTAGIFGRVEGTPAHSMIARLDDSVAAEQGDLFPDPALVAGAGFLLAGMRADGQRELAHPELHFATTPERLLNLSGTDAEAALDRVSGGSADFVIDTWDTAVCPDALACVMPDASVHVGDFDSILSDEEVERLHGFTWHDVMLHEFAHVVQKRWLADLSGSADFQRLFVDVPVPADFDPTRNYPIEHSADCMALATDPGYSEGYPGECTAAQLAFAGTIWDGSFRR